MCDKCETSDNGFVLLNNTACYSGIEFAMSNKGMLRVRTYPNLDDSGLFDSQDIINIDYCPICGRRLRND